MCEHHGAIAIEHPPIDLRKKMRGPDLNTHGPKTLPQFSPRLPVDAGKGETAAKVASVMQNPCEEHAVQAPAENGEALTVAGINAVLAEINEKASTLPGGQGPSKKNARRALQEQGLLQLSAILNIQILGNVGQNKSAILDAARKQLEKKSDAQAVKTLLSFLINPEAYSKNK